VNNKHETPTLALTRSVGIFFALQLPFPSDPKRTRVQNPPFQINRSAAFVCSCRLFVMLNQESQISKRSWTPPGRFLTPSAMPYQAPI
jgi:hypothetical protein